MSVGIVGSGPAAAAVESALGDVEASVATVEPARLPEFDLGVVVGGAGDAIFERANEAALAGGGRWIAVELGGVGGYPVVDAAVAGLGPSTACYECLAGRVAANLDPETEPAAAPPAHTARYAGALAGREAAAYLAEDDAAVFGQVLEVPHARRHLLPLPDCVCGDPPGRRLPHADRERDLDAALARAERGLDDRLGIVQEVGEAESFPVPYYLAHACDTAGFSDVAAARDAAGVAAGWDAAFMKALGEAMERYCAGVYRVADLESAPVDGVTAAVPPGAFVTEGDAATDDAIPWVAGENLASGEAVRVPAEFVFYPPPSERYRSPVTTGLGLGNSDTEAMLAGLYEVIERDAAMIAWYSTYEPLALEIEDEAFEGLVSRARSVDLAVSPILLTQDVDVPVVAVAVHREAWPAFAVGSAAHLDATRAARSALTEALQNWMELRGMGREAAGQAGGRIGAFADRPAEAEEFVDPPTAVPAASVGPETVPTGGAALGELVDRLAAVDMTPYAVRTTTRDVAACGFEGVRTLVPTAQPLFFEDAYFGNRAVSVPADLGFEPALDRTHHPFP